LELIICNGNATSLTATYKSALIKITFLFFLRRGREAERERERERESEKEREGGTGKESAKRGD